MGIKLKDLAVDGRILEFGLSNPRIWLSTAGSWSLVVNLRDLAVDGWLLEFGGWGANSRNLTVELRDLAVDRRILEFWEVRLKHLATSWSFGSQ